MEFTGSVWCDPTMVAQYVGFMRSTFPLADHQLSVLMQLIGGTGAGVERFIDLGCGDGLLSASLLARHPQACGVLVDFSEPMLHAAQRRLASHPGCRHVLHDLRDPAWVDAVASDGPFDVVMSGYMLHHQSDERKRALYREALDLLVPGGWFVNIDFVAASSSQGVSFMDELWIDHFRRVLEQQANRPVDPEEAEAHYRALNDEGIAYPAASVVEQCEWLHTAGFADVDCYFKIHQLAIVAGRKPMPTRAPTRG
jgi:tRNA (cmo5U34)-methyltransferase